MATFLSSHRLPNGDLALSACADDEAHLAAGGGDCPHDHAATWGRLDGDESDAAFLARAVREHAAVTDALKPPAPVAVDIAHLAPVASEGRGG